MIDKKFIDYSNEIAKLTLDIEKTCHKKEVLFCNSINITSIEFKCLRYILNNTFLQVKDIAEYMDLTAPRITSVLNSLENKGYITRIISKEDRRIIKVSLTSNGEIFVKKICKKYVSFHEKILSLIKDEEQLKNILLSLKTFQQTLEIFIKKESNNE